MWYLQEWIWTGDVPRFWIVAENPTEHQHRIWELWADAVVKIEEKPQQTYDLSTLMWFLYPPLPWKTRHQSYLEIKLTRDTLKLVQVIKHLIFSNDSRELYMVHAQVMSTINQFRMGQERGQSTQISKISPQKWDKSVINWVYVKVRLSKNPRQYWKRRCDNHNKWANEALEEKGLRWFFSILFLYMAEWHMYGKIIEDMEKAMLYKLDPFPKTINDACKLLNG